MKGLGERILTTHVGSLCRPAPLLEMVIDKVAGKPVDEAAFEAQVAESVKYVVAKQAEVGVDIPSDGEFSKPDFGSYMTGRLGGMKQEPIPPHDGLFYPQLTEEFPEFMKQYSGMYRTMWLPPEIPREKIDAALNAPRSRSICVEPLHYTGQAELQRDLDNFAAALAPHDFAGAFVPAATPSRSDAAKGDVYATGKDYLYALADAMAVEYKAIVDAGYMVQLDLGLPARNQVLYGNPNPTPEDLRRASEEQVEAYNHALRDIPTDRVRYHMCWGSMNTPHTTDVPLREIVDIILKIDAKYYVIEGANPPPRARMDDLEGYRPARGQGARPRHRQPPDQRGGASRARLVAHPELRQCPGARSGDRGNRLRLLAGLEHAARARGSAMGQAQGIGRRRRARHQGAVVTTA